MNISECKKPIHPVLAIYPGLAPKSSFEAILKKPVDGSVFLDTRKCQITPQNFCLWTPEKIIEFTDEYPDTEFRLHASIRVDGMSDCDDVKPWYDLSRYAQSPRKGRYYFEKLAELNQAIGSPCYTLHTGFRPKRDDMRSLARAYSQIESIMKCEIGIETLYPVGGSSSRYWISSWAEHEDLLKSGLNFVVDVSHLNIIFEHEGRNDELVDRLFESKNLVEIHLSANDGLRDSHKSLSELNDEWWMPYVTEYSGAADIFSEGAMS